VDTADATYERCAVDVEHVLRQEDMRCLGCGAFLYVRRIVEGGGG
jgi:hypothetical protein